MSESPWPRQAANAVLFVLDAGHRVEEDILRAWLDDNAPLDGTADVVVTPISRNQENIAAQGLQRALGQNEDPLICPLRVVWETSLEAKGRAPRFRDLVFGNQRRPSAWMARRSHRRHPERTATVAAEPATLGELRLRYKQRRGEDPDAAQLADYVAGQAGLALDLAERRLRGSRYKVPRRVAENLSARPRFKDAVKCISEETGRDVPDLQRESAEIMKELISIPRTFWIDVMGVFNRYMINLGYDTEMVIDQERLDQVRQMTRQHPSALLWTHKTHVDGFAMHSVFLENDFPAPHILGGVNMAFGGLGYMARRAGAIFIRRSFQDNPLYKMILRQYIGYLLEKRFPLTWAFEGTRSRVGKLMPPRYGLLKYVVEAAYTGDAENLHIIPVAINYDLIGDVSDYATEQAGATKQPESLRWFLGYLRGLRQPLGQIYVDIGEPVVLPRAPHPDDTLALQKIAFQVGVEVNKVTPITLTSLATMILLGAAPRALTRDELRDEMFRYLDWARERDILVTSTTNLDDLEYIRWAAQIMVDNGLLTRYDGGPELVYAISAENHGVANYYRNTTIHHFVNKAIAELALMYVATQPKDGSAAFWAEAERLRDLFKFEFFYAPTDEFRDQMRWEMNRYNDQWEQKLDADTAYAQQYLATMLPLVSHATLLSFVEAYRIVADVLARKSAGDELEEKDVVNECLAYGRQALLQRRITSEASIGKLLFQNGFKLMVNQGLNNTSDTDLQEKRLQMSQSLRELAHRIDIVRTIALPR